MPGLNTDTASERNEDRPQPRSHNRVKTKESFVFTDLLHDDVYTHRPPERFAATPSLAKW